MVIFLMFFLRSSSPCVRLCPFSLFCFCPEVFVPSNHSTKAISDEMFTRTQKILLNPNKKKLKKVPGDCRKKKHPIIFSSQDIQKNRSSILTPNAMLQRESQEFPTLPIIPSLRSFPEAWKSARSRYSLRSHPHRYRKTDRDQEEIRKLGEEKEQGWNRKIEHPGRTTQERDSLRRILFTPKDPSVLCYIHTFSSKGSDSFYSLSRFSILFIGQLGSRGSNFFVSVLYVESKSVNYILALIRNSFILEWHSSFDLHSPRCFIACSCTRVGDTIASIWIP